MMRVQGPLAGSPGLLVVLCRDTNVSANCTCVGGFAVALFANVATGPALPMNACPAFAEVTELPNVSEPAPNGAFSTGAGTRLPVASLHEVDPVGSSSAYRKSAPAAATSSMNGWRIVRNARPARASTPLASVSPQVPDSRQVCGSWSHVPVHAK